MNVKLRFPEETPDRAGWLVTDLESEIKKLRVENERIQTSITREDPRAGDFGTTLVMVLGAPAMVILAKAVRDWAKRKNQSVIEIGGARITNVELAQRVRLSPASAELGVSRVRHQGSIGLGHVAESGSDPNSGERRR